MKTTTTLWVLILITGLIFTTCFPIQGQVQYTGGTTVVTTDNGSAIVTVTSTRNSSNPFPVYNNNNTSNSTGTTVNINTNKGYQPVQRTHIIKDGPRTYSPVQNDPMYKFAKNVSSSTNYLYKEIKAGKHISYDSKKGVWK